MRPRDWQDILRDVVESDGDPDDWRAVAGDRRSGPGEDLFLGHPAAGVFHIKTYAKNPFEVRGVGTQVARKIDDDLADLFPERDAQGRFAVQSPPEDESQAERAAERVEEVVQTHADAPTTPDALFEDVMEAMESPAFGPMDYEFDERPETLADLSETFADAEELLDAELDDLVDEDEVGKSFM
ncbi:MAG: hypothetical protein ABEJ42_03220 [Halobacteriaceae archaeon]